MEGAEEAIPQALQAGAIHHTIRLTGRLAADEAAAAVIQDGGKIICLYIIIFHSFAIGNYQIIII